MKITGAKAHVFFDSFDETQVIEGGPGVATNAGAWYFVISNGAGSSLPYMGTVLRAPAAGNEQIALVEGDQVFPITEGRFCKTSVSLSAEEGSIDVSDDCDPGANILDGNVAISGSLAGFFSFDDLTNKFDTVTDDIISRFFGTVEDDGSGIYGFSERRNGQAYLLINLNSDAKTGQTENWLFIPVIISSMNMNMGNTEVVNKDLSWSKGEGRAVVYKRLKAA
jgi:hypothetical protein